MRALLWMTFLSQLLVGPKMETKITEKLKNKNPEEAINPPQNSNLGTETNPESQAHLRTDIPSTDMEVELSQIDSTDPIITDVIKEDDKTDSRVSHVKPKKLAGSQKKRLHKLMEKGIEFGEARKLCLLSMKELKDREGVNIASSSGYNAQHPQGEPSSVVATKRNRSDTTTPPESVHKRANTNTKSSYKDVLTTIKVAITNREPMTQDQQKILEKAILVEVDKTPANIPAPQFLGCSRRPEWLCIICADKESHVWLNNVVTKITPWPGAELKVLEGENFPKARIGVAWIPGEEIFSPYTIFNRLKAQNRFVLHTEKWKLLNVKKETKGQTLTFSMDEASYEALQSMEFKPFLNFNKIYIRIRENEESTHKTETHKTETTAEMLGESSAKPPVHNADTSGPSTSNSGNTGQETTKTPDQAQSTSSPYASSRTQGYAYKYPREKYSVGYRLNRHRK